MEYLGTAETMLALKVLKEESRFSRSTHKFILTKLYEKLREAGKEGGSINQAEFENAYAAAITEAVTDLTSSVVRRALHRSHWSSGCQVKPCLLPRIPHRVHCTLQAAECKKEYETMQRM